MTKPRRVYLAARYSRRIELHAYANALRQRGIVVTSRWLDGAHQLDDANQPIGDSGEALAESDSIEAADLRKKFAEDDYSDVITSDTLIAFTEPPRSDASRGGRHVELGLALAMCAKVVVIGYRENVFCWLPTIQFFSTFHDYITALEQL